MNALYFPFIYIFPFIFHASVRVEIYWKQYSWFSLEYYWINGDLMVFLIFHHSSSPGSRALNGCWWLMVPYIVNDLMPGYVLLFRPVCHQQQTLFVSTPSPSVSPLAYEYKMFSPFPFLSYGDAQRDPTYSIGKHPRIQTEYIHIHIYLCP